MSVGIYVQFRTFGIIRLPVNPSYLEVEQASRNRTENIVTIGDINILKLPGLRRVTLESFLPSEDWGQTYIETNNITHTPLIFVNYFRTVTTSKEPVNLVVTGMQMLPMRMAVEDFSYRWDAPDEDMYYRIELREWKEYGQKILELPEPDTDVVPSPAPATAAAVRDNFNKRISCSTQVLCTGTTYRTAAGGAVSSTMYNQTLRVDFVYKNAAYPYHLSTLDGQSRGWATESQLTALS